MISNVTTKQLTKMLYEQLQAMEYNVVLSKPTVESIFPAIVINTPLESTSKQYGKNILQKTFQISIECWAEEKYVVMKMMEETSQILANYNGKRISTTPDVLDEQTQKYKMIMTFEVKYNGLTNSFM